MINMKGILAYEGTHYLGWQEVGMGPTIEGALQGVLEQLLPAKAPLQAASRTDAGVHATGQVINFFVDKEIRLQSINALLPKDIRMVSLEEVDDDFHPTLDARSKEYHYFLCTGATQLPQVRSTSWHCPNLDVCAMEKASSYLVGEHDFGAFTNRCKEGKACTRRTLHKLCLRPLPENRLKIVLCANSFLFRMARNLVGTLVSVGQGKLKADKIPAILAGKDRRQAGVCAPAHGLCLACVSYALEGKGTSRHP